MYKYTNSQSTNVSRNAFATAVWLRLFTHTWWNEELKIINIALVKTFFFLPQFLHSSHKPLQGLNNPDVFSIFKAQGDIDNDRSLITHLKSHQVNGK